MYDVDGVRKEELDAKPPSQTLRGAVWLERDDSDSGRSNRYNRIFERKDNAKKRQATMNWP